MKKSLFALAALGALAGAAQAQSSVTVYGIVDMGMVGYNTRNANPISASATNPAVVGGSGLGFGQSAQSTNRLGFRGTEDLGGGTRAFFTLELGLAPMTTQLINSGATQNRQAFIGLGQKGLGQASIGTQTTLVHDAAAATDAGELNNIMGNMIYTVNTGLNNGATPYSAATGSALANAQSAGISYTIRQNNMLKLQTERMAGFRGAATLVLNNTNSSTQSFNATTGATSGGVNNQMGWGISADYSWKQLYATANYQAFTSQNPWGSGTAGSSATGSTSSTTVGSGVILGYPANGTPILAGSGQGSTLGINVKDNQAYYAITYDFGIVKAYLQYVDRKVTNENFSSNYIQRTAQQIGLRSNLTPTISAWASGGTGKYNAYGSGGTSNNIAGMQVGANYNLSKRTNLYAIYGQYSVSNAPSATAASSGYQNNGTNTAQNLNANSYNANNYAVGVRHTF